jgi:hypothetical protein
MKMFVHVCVCVRACMHGRLSSGRNINSTHKFYSQTVPCSLLRFFLLWVVFHVIIAAIWVTGFVNLHTKEFAFLSIVLLKMALHLKTTIKYMAEITYVYTVTQQSGEHLLSKPVSDRNWVCVCTVSGLSILGLFIMLVTVKLNVELSMGINIFWCLHPTDYYCTQRWAGGQ